MRAEIADARLDVQPAVGTQGHETVESDRPCTMRADRDANATHLRAAPLPRVGLPLVPPEGRFSLVQRFVDERAREALPLAVRLCRTEHRTSHWRVDFADLDLIDVE